MWPARLRRTGLEEFEVWDTTTSLSEKRFWRGRLWLFRTRNHLGSEVRNMGNRAKRIKRNLDTRHHELHDVDCSFVRGFAAGHFAIGHFAHVVAAVHGHVAMLRLTLVVMSWNGALVGHTAGERTGHPSGASKRRLQQGNSKQASHRRQSARKHVCAAQNQENTPMQLQSGYASCG